MFSTKQIVTVAVLADAADSMRLSRKEQKLALKQADTPADMPPSLLQMKDEATQIEKKRKEHEAEAERLKRQRELSSYQQELSKFLGLTVNELPVTFSEFEQKYPHLRDLADTWKKSKKNPQEFLDWIQDIQAQKAKEEKRLAEEQRLAKQNKNSGCDLGAGLREFGDKFDNGVAKCFGGILRLYKKVHDAGEEFGKKTGCNQVGERVREVFNLKAQV